MEKKNNPITVVHLALGPSTKRCGPGWLGLRKCPGRASLTTQVCERVISSSDIALRVDYSPICEVLDWWGGGRSEVRDLGGTRPSTGTVKSSGKGEAQRQGNTSMCRDHDVFALQLC